MWYYPQYHSSAIKQHGPRMITPGRASHAFVTALYVNLSHLLLCLLCIWSKWRLFYRVEQMRKLLVRIMYRASKMHFFNAKKIKWKYTLISFDMPAMFWPLFPSLQQWHISIYSCKHFWEAPKLSWSFSPWLEPKRTAVNGKAPNDRWPPAKAIWTWGHSLRTTLSSPGEFISSILSQIKICLCQCHFHNKPLAWTTRGVNQLPSYKTNKQHNTTSQWGSLEMDYLSLNTHTPFSISLFFFSTSPDPRSKL